MLFASAYDVEVYNAFTVLLPAKNVVAFAYTLAPTDTCVAFTVEIPTLRSTADKFAVALLFDT